MRFTILRHAGNARRLAVEPVDALFIPADLDLFRPGACSGIAHAQDSPLRIIQFNVGQGDAALVVTPENRRLLIDAGRSPDAVAYIATPSTRSQDSTGVTIPRPNF